MRVLSIVGARPQFVKLAPVAAALAAAGTDHVIVHTGQHYDAEMSDVFFADLRIPEPDVHLGVGSGSHGVQTGAMLAALDGVLDEHRPGLGLVYGDTNSTLAGAAGGGEAAPARRPPRGRPALLQPADARGAQPGAHRPRRRPPARAHRGRACGHLRRRGARRPRRARRRRHDRRLLPVRDAVRGTAPELPAAST